MKLFRDLKWKLADRFPDAFDKKTLFYNPQRAAPMMPKPGPKVHGWDAMLIAILSVVMIGLGLIAVFVGCFVIWALITS